MIGTELGSGGACTDCLVLLANGETPPEMDEDETAAWLAEIDRRHGAEFITCGGPHDDDCPNTDDDGAWLGTTDCDCENLGFSWSSCDVCGSRLGGDRYAVTFFAREAVR